MLGVAESLLETYGLPKISLLRRGIIYRPLFKFKLACFRIKCKSIDNINKLSSYIRI